MTLKTESCATHYLMFSLFIFFCCCCCFQIGAWTPNTIYSKWILFHWFWINVKFNGQLPDTGSKYITFRRLFIHHFHGSQVIAFDNLHSKQTQWIIYDMKKGREREREIKKKYPYTNSEIPWGLHIYPLNVDIVVDIFQLFLFLNIVKRKKLVKNKDTLAHCFCFGFYFGFRI